MANRHRIRRRATANRHFPIEMELKQSSIAPTKFEMKTRTTSVVCGSNGVRATFDLRVYMRASICVDARAERICAFQMAVSFDA